MNAVLSRAQRLRICALALLCAAWLFRPQLADALVARGDELLYRNDLAGAAAHYARALRLDPDSSVAADRFVFAQMQEHRAASLARALRAAGAYLRRHPDDTPVLTDRALCFLIARRYAAAARDFRRAGALSGDRRDRLFAEVAERRARGSAR